MIRMIARGGIVAVLMMGLTVAGVRAQLFRTHLPYPHNEAAGTGYAGSEISGGMRGGNGGSPAIAHGIPTAYGADFGDVFGGTGYQRYIGPRIPERNDGAFFVGVGMGDAHRLVGAEVTFALYDLVGDTFQDGSLSIKLHRHLYRGLAVAVGVEDIIRYGDWVNKSAYAVATHTFQFKSRPFTGLSLTAGVGDGRFNSMENLLRDANKVNVFGGMSLEVFQKMNVIGTWYGQDLNLGLSFVVPGPMPLTITPVWVSALDNHVSGRRLALSIGTSYRFR